MHLVLTLPTTGGARPDPLAPLDPLAAAVLARSAADGHALAAVTRRPPRCGVPDTDLGAARLADALVVRPAPVGVPAQRGSAAAERAAPARLQRAVSSAPAPVDGGR